MKVLCIESVADPRYTMKVEKGKVYTAIGRWQTGCIFRGLDQWYSLEEFSSLEFAHVSLFIELPDLEGQEFSKKEELVVLN